MRMRTTVFVKLVSEPAKPGMIGRCVSIMVVLLLFASPEVSMSAAAEGPGEHERTFIRALELFDTAKSADDYRSCATELESIIADGIESGAVFYNLGNAYFRAGEYGRAILNYRKAKPYRPRDSYLEANLQQALALAPGQLPQPPSTWWNHVLFWTEWLSFPSKVRLAALLLIAGAILLTVAIMFRRLRICFVVAVLCSFALAVIADLTLNNPKSLRNAVITGETIARKGTGKDYEPAFNKPLKDGAEFTVLSETSDWTFGHFEGIGDGWVRNEFVAR